MHTGAQDPIVTVFRQGDLAKITRHYARGRLLCIVTYYIIIILYSRSCVSYTRLPRNHWKTTPVSFSHLSSVSHDFYIKYTIIIILLLARIAFVCVLTCVFVLSSRAPPSHGERTVAALPWWSLKNKSFLRLNKYAIADPPLRGRYTPHHRNHRTL